MPVFKRVFPVWTTADAAHFEDRIRLFRNNQMLKPKYGYELKHFLEILLSIRA